MERKNSYGIFDFYCIEAFFGPGDLDRVHAVLYKSFKGRAGNPGFAGTQAYCSDLPLFNQPVHLLGGAIQDPGHPVNAV